MTAHDVLAILDERLEAIAARWRATRDYDEGRDLGAAVDALEALREEIVTRLGLGGGEA